MVHEWQVKDACNVEFPALDALPHFIFIFSPPPLPSLPFPFLVYIAGLRTRAEVEEKQTEQATVHNVANFIYFDKPSTSPFPATSYTLEVGSENS